MAYRASTEGYPCRISGIQATILAECISESSMEILTYLALFLIGPSANAGFDAVCVSSLSRDLYSVLPLSYPFYLFGLTMHG